MTDSEFATRVVDLLEKGQQQDLDVMVDSFYVWSWRRAREIHALLQQYEAENKRPIIVRLAEVGQ